jgi:hypothetical protein
VNSGDFVVVSTANFAYGIDANTSGLNSPLSIDNSGDLSVTASGCLRAFAGERSTMAVPSLS